MGLQTLAAPGYWRRMGFVVKLGLKGGGSLLGDRDNGKPGESRGRKATRLRHRKVVTQSHGATASNRHACRAASGSVAQGGPTPGGPALSTIDQERGARGYDLYLQAVAASGGP